FAKDAQLPRGRVQKAAHHREGGGLPRAVRADEPVALALLYFERDVVHRDLGPEVLADVPKLDGDAAHTSLARNTRYDAPRKIIFSTRLTAGCLNIELHIDASAMYASENTSSTSHSFKNVTAAFARRKSGSTNRNTTTISSTHTNVSSASTLLCERNLPTTS